MPRYESFSHWLELKVPPLNATGGRVNGYRALWIGGETPLWVETGSVGLRMLTCGIVRPAVGRPNCCPTALTGGAQAQTGGSARARPASTASRPRAAPGAAVVTYIGARFRGASISARHASVTGPPEVDNGAWAAVSSARASPSADFLQLFFPTFKPTLSKLSIEVHALPGLELLLCFSQPREVAYIICSHFRWGRFHPKLWMKFVKTAQNFELEGTLGRPFALLFFLLVFFYYLFI